MKKGNKPDFHDAAGPEPARKLYDFFYDKMREGYTPDRVKNGVFQAMMEVELNNDGPVGVDYCSEDAAVYFDFLAPFLAAIESILTDPILGHNRNQHQSPQKGIQGSEKWRQRVQWAGN
jgi:D-Tyr-tRNAtyr deacylase